MTWFFNHSEHVVFKRQFKINQLSNARRMALFAICFYFCFAFLDVYLSQDNSWKLLAIRTSITLILFCFLLTTYHSRWKKYWQYIFAWMIFLGGLGVIVMSNFVEEQFKPIYSQGLLLVIFYGYTMNKLLLTPAILSGFGITLCYLAYTLFISTIQVEFLIASLFFQLSTNMFGVFSVYFMQKTAYQAFKKNEDLKNINRHLVQQSETDGLTGIGNRRYFDSRFEQLFCKRIRQLDYISIIICDIDFFKNYNDAYGHLKGDDALKKVARILSEQLPPEKGFVARFGGEEFILVIFNHDMNQTQTFISRIQENLKQEDIRHPKSLAAKWLTLSFGYVTLDLSKTSPNQAYQQLIKRADHCLYQAKQEGRNQIVGTTYH